MKFHNDYPEIKSDSVGRNRAVRTKWDWLIAILVTAVILAAMMASRLLGQSELLEEQSLHEALKARKHVMSIALIRVSTGLNKPNENGDIPLVLAANDSSADAYDVVRELLGRGALPNEPDKSGHTALHWASFHGNLAVVDLLIRNGADVNAATKTEWETPVYMALANGKERVAEFLEMFGASVPDEDRMRLRAAGQVKNRIDEMIDLPKPDSLTEEQWVQQIADAALASVDPSIAEQGLSLDAMEAFRKVMEQPKPEGVTPEQWQQNRMAEAHRLLLSGEIPVE